MYDCGARECGSATRHGSRWATRLRARSVVRTRATASMPTHRTARIDPGRSYWARRGRATQAHSDSREGSRVNSGNTYEEESSTPPWTGPGGGGRLLDASCRRHTTRLAEALLRALAGGSRQSTPTALPDGRRVLGRRRGRAALGATAVLRWRRVLTLARFGRAATIDEAGGV